MVLKIGSFVWGVTDLERGMKFWIAALGFEPREAPSDDWVVLVPPERDGTQLALQLINSPRARRHHIDLYTEDQAGEVKRLVGLGATRVENWKYEADADYVVLADPDGNRFCVIDGFE
ncbi:MAG: VOC family protein [Pseudolysinimonas sp.]